MITFKVARAVAIGEAMIEMAPVDQDFYRRGFAGDTFNTARHLGRALGQRGQVGFVTRVGQDGISDAILSGPARDRLIAALERARSHGARVSFDPNIRPRLWSSKEDVRATIPRFLDVTDIALPSFDDEQANWGDATPQDTAARFAASGITEVVVKNGAGPVATLVAGRIDTHETPEVSDIKDTTGAGDAFNAGYLAARLVGHDPQKAVAHGQKMSAEVIRHFGARIPKDAIARVV